MHLVFYLVYLTAAHVNAAPAEESFDLQIPSKPAADAVKSLAYQTGRSVLFQAADVDTITANAISGRYSVQQALDALLEGTDLSGGLTNSGVITISRVDSSDGQGEVMLTQNNNETSIRRRGLLGGLAAVFSIGVGAQQLADAGEEPEQMDEIIVTGTNLRGVTNPAAPVIVFDREDIERSGQTQLAEFIQAIPQNFRGGLSDAASASPGGTEPGNLGSGTAANLRGLGAESTLVLVNGRRLAPAGLASFTDLSTIPISAVERIEIVTDGSSAIYGSDAIGGVINIILRDELDGAETTLRYGSVTSGNRYEIRASQALGTSWDSGRVFANYEYFTETPLRSTDRSFTASSEIPFDLSSDTENHSAFLSGSQDITEGIALFGTGQYATRDTRTSTATVLGDPTTFDIGTEQYGAVLGLEVAIGGSWEAELSGTYNKYENDAITELPTTSFVQTVRQESDIMSWDLKADGRLFSTGGGDVKLGLGGGVREEKYQLNLNEDERDVTYLFGEALFPVIGAENAVPGIRSFEISAALRYEDYSDAGSSADGKIGVVWSPINELRFRGTLGTSFRAPLLSEAGPGPNGTFLATIPDPLSSTGTSLGMFLGGRALSEAVPELGTPLKPEEAEIYTLGFDFEPGFLPGFYLSVSYFNIDFTDRIASPPLDIFNLLTDPAFAPFVTRNPTAEEVMDVLSVTTSLANFSGIPDDELPNGGVAFLYDFRTANLARTDNAGFDFDIGYSTETNLGAFSANIAGSYLTDIEDQLTNAAPVLEALNTYQNPIDLRMRGSFAWSSGGWRTGLFVNYSDDYRDNRSTPENKIDSSITYDLTIQYDFGDNPNSTILRDTRLSFGALNLLDEDPPFVENITSANIVFNYDVRNATAMGRLLTFQLAKSW